MSNIPADLKYAKSHEWIRPGADGIVTIGITEYAQSSLGDITYVQLPQPGAALKAGDSFGVVESVKAASDLYAPVAGAVVEVNTGLDSTPEKVNQEPYDGGWMLKLKIDDPAELAALLDAAGYAAIIG